MSYWSQPHRAPLRNRTLSPEAIARSAAELLDSDGPDGLTLRKLAMALGVAQSSLYGHVRGRDDVLDLALDHALRQEALTQEPLFHGDLPQTLLAWHAHLLRHPWTISHVVRRAPLGPGYLALSDRICELLLDSGVHDDELLATTYSLCNFVLGCAMAQCAAETDEPHAPGSRLGTRTGSHPDPQHPTDPPNPWSSLLPPPPAKTAAAEDDPATPLRHVTHGFPPHTTDLPTDASGMPLGHLRRAARARQPTWEDVVRQGIAKLLAAPAAPPTTGKVAGSPG